MLQTRGFVFEIQLVSVSRTVKCIGLVYSKTAAYPATENMYPPGNPYPSPLGTFFTLDFPSWISLARTSVPPRPRHLAVTLSTNRGAAEHFGVVYAALSLSTFLVIGNDLTEARKRDCARLVDG